MSTFDAWWYGILAITFFGIRYNSVNSALFVVILFGGLVLKSLS